LQGIEHGRALGPLTDVNAYETEQRGVWFNRVFTYEVGGRREDARTIHFAKACLHCENPQCVTVCPTGASYKRAADGIVLVDVDRCIGCKLCAWACPYGAREFDEDQGVMKKCTLCVDRLYNDNLAPADRAPVCVATCPTKARHFGDFNDPESNVSRLVRERGGFDLAPELGYRPTSKYLPSRPRRSAPHEASKPGAPGAARDHVGGFLRWVDRALSR